MLLKQPFVHSAPYTDDTYHRAYDTLDFDANFALQRKMTETIMPQLEALTPGGGAYLNEADFRQPNWQNVFYGVNYDDLKSIKIKYDPYGLFYGLTAVGSENWTTRSDGRLCRTSNSSSDLA